mmetsp:Transcript_3264/g.4872  ORF Transcript_3264/g.4872 Transcript_3264/m.4872 type:complete len:235 (+) Transcript_3264:132-836(+)
MSFVSWGESFLLVGASFYFIGRKDLPKASRFLGTQIGRMVGLLQGARVRADRFTAQHELRQLQNEFRSGLRELESVRSELAVSVSSQGLVGRTLGATVPGVNRKPTQDVANKLNPELLPEIQKLKLTFPSANVEKANQESINSNSTISNVRALAPRSHAVAAVAEEEWQKQGIGFQSIAEKRADDTTGSSILSNLYQQTLIYDQHDRVVQEQDEAISSRLVKTGEKVNVVEAKK